MTNSKALSRSRRWLPSPLQFLSAPWKRGVGKATSYGLRAAQPGFDALWALLYLSTLNVEKEAIERQPNHC
jgi:hypothetical protein